MRYSNILMASFVLTPLVTAQAAWLGLTPDKLTLNINLHHLPAVDGGEQAWWPVPQQAKPFASSTFALTPGLPPGGAWPSPGVANAYWSGWSGEAEAYPNLQALENLPADPGMPMPLRVNKGAIHMVAQPISAVETAALPPQLAGRSIVSGALNSYPYGQTYGYFEILAKVPHGQGLWPAFWMLPVGASKTTELDVTEILGNDTTTSYSTIHTTDTAWLANPANNPPCIQYKAPEDLSQGFHRYGVDWESDTITFYLDRQIVKQFATPADMHQPMYFILNLAVGTANTWAGPPNASTVFPADYSVASVMAWQR